MRRTSAGLHAGGLQDGDHERRALLLHVVLRLHVVQQRLPAFAAARRPGSLHMRRRTLRQVPVLPCAQSGMRHKGWNSTQSGTMPTWHVALCL